MNGPEFEKLFGRRLRAIREKQGLSLRQAEAKAAALGIQVSGPSIGAYERGERSPAVGVAAELASLFGVAVEELIGSPDPHEALKSAMAETRNAMAALSQQILLIEDAAAEEVPAA